MVTITLEGCGLGVERVQSPDGEMRLLRLLDRQSGIIVQVPFDQDGWAALMRAGSGIQVANGIQLPPPPAGQ